MYVLKRAPSITFSFLRVDSSSGERQPIKHTSQDFRWTRLAPASRKWMSGQAAALAATQDRTPFVNLLVPHPLRDLALPSVRRPPSPLDFYLSWMSPGFVPIFPPITSVSQFRVVFHMYG